MAPYSKTTWNQGISPFINATNLNKIEQGIADAQATADALAVGVNPTAMPGAIDIDSFKLSGYTDDQMLADALSYGAAQTFKPAFYVRNRQYNFVTPRTLYPGFELGGLTTGDQGTSQNEVGNKLRYTGGGTWWTIPSPGGNACRGVKLHGLMFEGNSTSQFMGGAGTLGKAHFYNLGFNLWKNVIGSPASKVTNTACLFNGWWNINNSYDTAICMGGSDSNFFRDGCLLDSPQNIMDPSKYHIIWDYQEKTDVGPMYITADKASGMLINGGTTTAGLVLNGAGRNEGRNTTTPCFGSNLRITGGVITVRDWWFAYGASALNTTGHTGEGGVITQSGGDVLYDGLYYDKTAAIAETVPFIHVSGGKARVRNVRLGAKGGVFTGLPRVKAAGGTVDADNSVTVI